MSASAAQPFSAASTNDDEDPELRQGTVIPGTDEIDVETGLGKGPAVNGYGAAAVGSESGAP